MKEPQKGIIVQTMTWGPGAGVEMTWRPKGSRKKVRLATVSGCLSVTAQAKGDRA